MNFRIEKRNFNFELTGNCVMRTDLKLKSLQLKTKYTLVIHRQVDLFYRLTALIPKQKLNLRNLSFIMHSVMFQLNLHPARFLQNINFIIQTFKIAFSLPGLLEFMNTGHSTKNPTDMR